MPEMSGGIWERFASLFRLAEEREQLLVPAVILAGVLLSVLLLVLPGATYSGKYTNDVFIFFDNAHRLLAGQVPNRDFHSPLGPLAYVLPAFGLRVGGLGGFMPWATAAFLLLLTPILLYVCRSRLPVGFAIGFGIYTVLLAAGPVNIGDEVDSTSFAMFYNRWGYALLGLLFLMILPRREGRGSRWIDAAAAALLLMLMFYLKVSYFMFGAALMVPLFFLLPSQRFMAPASLALTALGIGLVELAWGGTGNYLRDIAAAAEASGALRGTLFTLSRLALQNFMACILFLFVMGLAVYRSVRWQTLLLCLYMAGAGLLLANQNAQGPGLLTLIPAALVAILAPGRNEATTAPLWPRLTGSLLLAALVLPPATVSAVTLGYFSIKSARPTGGPYEQQIGDFITAEGMIDPLKIGPQGQRRVYRAERADLDIYNKIKNTKYRQGFSQPEFLITLKDGMDLLRREPRLEGKIFVFDMGNPFSGLLGRESPRGVDAWNHVNRTFTETSYRPPQRMFADVDVVLIPKVATDLPTVEAMQRVYGPYLSLAFEPVATSDYWRAYRKRRL